MATKAELEAENEDLRKKLEAAGAASEIMNARNPVGLTFDVPVIRGGKMTTIPGRCTEVHKDQVCFQHSDGLKVGVGRVAGQTVFQQFGEPVE